MESLQRAPREARMQVPTLVDQVGAPQIRRQALRPPLRHTITICRRGVALATCLREAPAAIAHRGVVVRDWPHSMDCQTRMQTSRGVGAQARVLIAALPT